MHRYLCNHLARDSHLLQLVFFARYIYEPAMPIYLLPGSFERIREALKTTRITIVTAPAAAALADIADATFDGYSIADVSSYLSETDFGTFMDEIMRTARAEARLCSRGIFVHRPLPARPCSSCAARSQPGTTAVLRRSGDGARIPGGHAADEIALGGSSMRSRRILCFATVAISAFIGPAPARAGLGLEVMLRPGYGSAGDKSPVLYQPTGGKQMQPSSIWAGTANPYGGGFVLDVAVGYQPLSVHQRRLDRRMADQLSLVIRSPGCFQHRPFRAANRRIWSRLPSSGRDAD